MTKKEELIKVRSIGKIEQTAIAHHTKSHSG